MILDITEHVIVCIKEIQKRHLIENSVTNIFIKNVSSSTSHKKIHLSVFLYDM